jgi:hypothetical protein
LNRRNQAQQLLALGVQDRSSREPYPFLITQRAVFLNFFVGSSLASVFDLRGLWNNLSMP